MSDRAFPPVIVGGWQLSAGHRSGPASAEDLFAEFSRIADAGLRTFDCADIYTGVEEFLGEFRRRYRNERGAEAAAAIRVHTKYVPDHEALPNLSRSQVESVIDRSLTRLGVDRLDMVQFAWWDYASGDYLDVLRWLRELQEAGKIAQLGATNFDTEHLREFAEAGLAVAAHQVQFSALDHRPEDVPRGTGSEPWETERSATNRTSPDSPRSSEEPMSTFCETSGTALLCYGSLAGGFLADRYLGLPAPEPPLANRSLVKYRLIIDEYGGWDRYQALLETLRSIADAHSASVAQVALAYALTRPAVTSVILGASNAARIIEAGRATELDLTSTQVHRIRTLARDAPGPAGPVFGLERDKTGAHGRIMRYNLDAGEV